MPSDSKISQLPVGGALTGTELLIAVQGGADVQTTPAAIRTYLLGQANTFLTTQTIANATDDSVVDIKRPNVANKGAVVRLSGTTAPKYEWYLEAGEAYTALYSYALDDDILAFDSGTATLSTPGVGTVDFGTSVLSLTGTHAAEGITFGGSYGTSCIKVTGTAASYAMDFAGGTYTSGGAIRLPNNVKIFGRNAANSADVSMLLLNTGNEAQFDAPVRFSNNVNVADAKNIAVQTTTGTKIGTATTQKLGFWNATPVAQQTVTGSRAAGAALADLLTKLATVGLIVDGTSA